MWKTFIEIPSAITVICLPPFRFYFSFNITAFAFFYCFCASFTRRPLDLARLWQCLCRTHRCTTASHSQRCIHIYPDRCSGDSDIGNGSQTQILKCVLKLKSVTDDGNACCLVHWRRLAARVGLEIPQFATWLQRPNKSLPLETSIRTACIVPLILIFEENGARTTPRRSMKCLEWWLWPAERLKSRLWGILTCGLPLRGTVAYRLNILVKC